MNKLLILPFLIELSLNLYSQNTNALDDKYGFRDAKFEMPVSTFKNIKLFFKSDLDQEVGYSANNVDLSIGDYKLDGIEYFFYKGRLSSIQIRVSQGYSNQNGVLEILEIAYGKGVFHKGNYEVGIGEDSYTWEGQKVDMTYYIDTRQGHNGRIKIWCKKLLNEMIQENRMKQEMNDKKKIDAAKRL